MFAPDLDQPMSDHLRETFVDAGGAAALGVDSVKVFQRLLRVDFSPDDAVGRTKDQYDPPFMPATRLRAEAGPMNISVG